MVKAKGAAAQAFGIAMKVRGAWLAFGVLLAACDRKEAPPPPPSVAATTTGTVSVTSTPIPAVPPVIEGDARDAARALFGIPPKPGRVIGSVGATTNAEPQVNTAGVLAFTGANGRVFTVFGGPTGLRVAGPMDLGPVRSLATDGPHVCASDRVSVRCADVDGGGVAVRTVTAGETTGLWGGQGVMLRASTNGLETSLEASADGFSTTRAVEIPRRRKVVAATVESPTRWTVVMLPTEGTVKPRYGLTVDAGRTAIADFGALDRAGWSNGDRLWSDQLVTGAFSTETIVAERGEKQSSITLPWSAAGAFAFARRALFLFGRGNSGNGGFLLLEFPSRRVTSITPSGAHPIIAAGRVGGAIVAVTDEGKVLAWE